MGLIKIPCAKSLDVVLSHTCVVLNGIADHLTRPVLNDGLGVHQERGVVPNLQQLERSADISSFVSGEGVIALGQPSQCRLHMVGQFNVPHGYAFHIIGPQLDGEALVVKDKHGMMPTQFRQ